MISIDQSAMISLYLPLHLGGRQTSDHSHFLILPYCGAELFLHIADAVMKSRQC